MLSNNSNHFGSVCRIVWQDAGRRFYFIVLVSFGVMFALFMFNTYNTDYNVEWRSYDPVVAMEEGFLATAMALLGCYGASLVGNCMRDKASAISALMLPASQLDKYIARMLLFIPVFFVVYAIGALAVDALRYVCAVAMKGSSHNIYMLVGSMDFKSFDIWGPFAGYMAVQSFFVLGGVVWPKRGILLTPVAMFVIGFIGVMFCIAMVEMAEGYEFVWLERFADDHELLRRRTTGEVLWYAFCAFVCAVNYVLAYFRLKEIEIVQRW